jgi:hypothetical protein
MEQSHGIHGEWQGHRGYDKHSRERDEIFLSGTLYFYL